MTDLLEHGSHPFPADVEWMIRRLHEASRGKVAEAGLAPFDWARGRDLAGARAWLRRALAEAGVTEPPPSAAWWSRLWLRIRYLARDVAGPP